MRGLAAPSRRPRSSAVLAMPSARALSVKALLSKLAHDRADEAGYMDARNGERVTWSDVERQALDWAGRLPAGTAVGLRARNPAAFCRAYLAALASDICVVPLDPRATDDELAALLDVLGVVDLVVGTEADAGKADSGVNVWVSSRRGLRLSRRTRRPRVEASGAAVLLPTSGTTGQPKVVGLTESQLLGAATRIARHHELNSLDRGYSPLPLFHVNAQVVGILSTLVAGASLVVEERFQRSEFWATAEELAVTWLNLVPAILGLLGNEPPTGRAVTEKVRFARSASAPLHRAVRERFQEKAGIGVLETYGMTEAASQIAANPMCEAERRPDSVGRPVGVPVRIVHDDGHEVSSDEVGNIEIGGPNVIDSYLGPGRSRLPARNHAGWLPTGDLGRRDSDGYLYLSGRSDDVINRAGEKTYPREIEDVLRRNPRVGNAVAVGRPHPLFGAEIVAFVQPCQHLDETGARTLSDELLAECGRSLSRHKRPASLFVVDSLPTGPTGKVVRRLLQHDVTAMPVEERSD